MPDTHNTQNFFAHGGSELVIGGKLTILEGAEVTGIQSVFTPAANQADSTASTIATLKEDFNTLLASLKTAGLMEPDAPEEEEDEDDDEDDDENGNGEENGGTEEPGGDA